MSDVRLKAVMIDDEERARNILGTLLAEYCPEVEVVATCGYVPDGVLAINKHKPDIVFLDIEMPEYNGFELLGFFQNVDFEIIFVTAYSEYALRAFEVSAVDYLLKPVEIDQLKNAIAKVIQKRNSSNMQQRLELLRDSFKGEDVRKIALPMSDGLLFVEVADIVLLEAEGAYTTVYLQNGSKLVVSKKLKFFEDVLMNRPSFFRVHRSNIINMNYIKKYVRGSSTLVMDNNMNIPVARDKKQEFEGSLKELRFSI